MDAYTYNQGTYYVYLNIRRYLKVENIERVREHPEGFLSFMQLVNAKERPVYTVAKNLVGYYYRVDDELHTKIEEHVYQDSIVNDHYSLHVDRPDIKVDGF